MEEQPVSSNLSPEEARVVEAAARRTVQLLRDGELLGELLTATEVAIRLKVRRTWVYRHREELGSVRLGDGPNAPLRFPAKRIADFANQGTGTQADAGRRREPKKPPRGRRSATASPTLMRYRGDGSSG